LHLVILKKTKYPLRKVGISFTELLSAAAVPHLNLRVIPVILR